MSVNLGTLLSSQFRVNSLKDFENDPRLEKANSLFTSSLKINRTTDNRVYLSMHGLYPTLTPCGVETEYFCVKENKWFEYKEPKDVEVNICEFIQEHIHHDDMCRIIVTSADRSGKNVGFEGAVITSEKTNFLSEGLHSFERLDKKASSDFRIETHYRNSNSTQEPQTPKAHCLAEH